MTNFTTTVSMGAFLATGNGDINASSGSFPAFATTPLQNSSGTTIANTFTLAGYLELTATPVSTFAQTPAFTYTSTSGSISGSTSTCYVFSLGGGPGNTAIWKQQFSSSGKTSTSATFAAQSISQVSIGNVAGNSSGSGPTYLAIACQ